MEYRDGTVGEQSLHMGLLVIVMGQNITDRGQLGILLVTWSIVI